MARLSAVDALSSAIKLPPAAHRDIVAPVAGEEDEDDTLTQGAEAPVAGATWSSFTMPVPSATAPLTPRHPVVKSSHAVAEERHDQGGHHGQHPLSPHVLVLQRPGRTVLSH